MRLTPVTSCEGPEMRRCMLDVFGDGLMARSAGVSLFVVCEHLGHAGEGDDEIVDGGGLRGELFMLASRARRHLRLSVAEYCALSGSTGMIGQGLK
jgi:hypothetical protein